MEREGGRPEGADFKAPTEEGAERPEVGSLERVKGQMGVEVGHMTERAGDLGEAVTSAFASLKGAETPEELSAALTEFRSAVKAVPEIDWGAESLNERLLEGADIVERLSKQEQT